MQLIPRYELALEAPGCSPGAATWSARATLEADIEAVLPYLNAELAGADFDQAAKVLIWKDGRHSFAFRCREIRASPAEDREEARSLIDRAVALANQAWQGRESIQPRYDRRRIPNLMQIYRLLPRTNCGRCGCATCMAFAAALREAQTGLARCTELEQPARAGQRAALAEMLGISGAAQPSRSRGVPPTAAPADPG